MYTFSIYLSVFKKNPQGIAGSMARTGPRNITSMLLNFLPAPIENVLPPPNLLHTSQLKERSCIFYDPFVRELLYFVYKNVYLKLGYAVFTAGNIRGVYKEL